MSKIARLLLPAATLLLFLALYRSGRRRNHRVIQAVPSNINYDKLQTKIQMLHEPSSVRYNVEYNLHNPKDQRILLANKGNMCHTDGNAVIDKYLELERWINSSEDPIRLQKTIRSIQLSLWKYCALGSGYADAFVDYEHVYFLDSFDQVFDSISEKNYIISDLEDGSINTDVVSLGHKCGKMIAKLMVSTIISLGKSEVTRPHYHWQEGAKLQALISESKYGKQFYPLQSKCGRKQNQKEQYFCEVRIQPDSHVVLFLQNSAAQVFQQESVGIAAGQIYKSIVKERSIDRIDHSPRSNKYPTHFDFFSEMDCLPSRKCSSCLKHDPKTDDATTKCEECAELCGCYCKTLCHIDSPVNPIKKELLVHPPLLSSNTESLIPRIIHQTYHQTITRESHPKESRLVESLKATGWEYKFYDDEAIIKFLRMHFPSEIQEAYDAIMPGAFKADFFRYCVLLIEGGVYADIDVFLSVDLDLTFVGDVGFMTVVDEPGAKHNHRSCLWNGFIAVAPGHPFISKTIEMVVNVVRNRFKSIDIDNMMCPGPVLHLSHQFDLLYVTGPCIFGAAVNNVLQRHPQAGFEPGELSLWPETMKPELDDERYLIPGRSVILSQNKDDMGWHRFTWLERNTIIAGTDIPGYSKEKPTEEHYSQKTREKNTFFGLHNVYKDQLAANENIQLKIVPPYAMQ